MHCKCISGHMDAVEGTGTALLNPDIVAFLLGAHTCIVFYKHHTAEVALHTGIGLHHAYSQALRLLWQRQALSDKACAVSGQVQRLSRCAAH